MYYKGKVVLFMTLKSNLRRFRERAGFEQAKEFAKFAGIPYSSYSAYERGSWPNEENLVKLATALNVSIDTLIGYKQEEPDELQKAVDLCNKSGINTELISTNGNFKVRVRPIGKAGAAGLFFDLTKKEFFDIIDAALNSQGYKEAIFTAREITETMLTLTLNKQILSFNLRNLTNKAKENI